MLKDCLELIISSRFYMNHNIKYENLFNIVIRKISELIYSMHREKSTIYTAIGHFMEFIIFRFIRYHTFSDKDQLHTLVDDISNILKEYLDINYNRKDYYKGCIDEYIRKILFYTKREEDNI